MQKERRMGKNCSCHRKYWHIKDPNQAGVLSLSTSVLVKQTGDRSSVLFSPHLTAEKDHGNNYCFKSRWWGSIFEVICALVQKLWGQHSNYYITHRNCTLIFHYIFIQKSIINSHINPHNFKIPISFQVLKVEVADWFKSTHNWNGLWDFRQHNRRI